MRKRKGRSKKSKSGMTMIVITVLVLFIIITYKKIDLDRECNILRAEKAKYEKQLDELNEEKENMQAYRDYVYSDDNIESIARERLGLVYPNEIVFEPEDD